MWNASCRIVSERRVCMLAIFKNNLVALLIPGMTIAVDWYVLNQTKQNIWPNGADFSCNGDDDFTN